MNQETVLSRIDYLIQTRGVQSIPADSQERLHGAISLMTALYGADSPQVKRLQQDAEKVISKYHVEGAADQIDCLAIGALRNLKGEVEAGLLASLQRVVSGEVLSDFLQLSRQALDEKGDGPKNVAAVLAAALFEDTIRRLAKSNSIPHIEKLQDVITELKSIGVLQGSQVGIANSYLNFRNNALHAQWDKIERESVASVLGFVEQILLKNFS